MADGDRWIRGAIKRPGAFTAKARARGLTVAEFAAKVRANPGRYSLLTRRQANLAHTLRGIARKLKGRRG